ncbi:hypothetical protein ES705_16515 [subsurface metagenome]|jgi:hypothetical protein
METIINLILMKRVDVKKLKSGDFVLAFDFGLCEWFKCKVNNIKKFKVNNIKKFIVTLEYVDGGSKGFVFYETLGNLKNPDYYKQAE